ncbi:hypothetical protein Vadar_002132 [Vaccinium darrowii]|uniref:Uncharacterized protein n=1 Tax=Vaccinium darrowii TaxID=229202 RepID=A0ACB7YIQ3_9ERIC|nr:hypothetical protein Vadar_002132 [Vaccinium darrowii]
MKLSFSLPPKPSSSKQTTNLKPSHSFNTDDQDPSKPSNKEYVTEFDASRTVSQQQSNKLVIPPIPNEYRPQKKMKNLELPLQPSDRQDLRFEVEKSSLDVADGGPNISYGLNLRNSSSDSVDGKKNESVETVMLQKLKEDLNRLPDDRGLDEYADMPVEGFGAALLAGYGWYEGRGIGRNPKGDVKVVQYEKRTAKEGLGFSSETPPSSNNKKRGKEQRSRKGEEEKGLGLGFSSDMPTHNSNGNGKKRGQEQRSGIGGGGEEEGLGFSLGDVVRIVAGRDVGLKGRVVEVVTGGGFVVVKLLRSEEEVKVRIGDVTELGSVEEERCLRKLKELKIRGGSKDEMVCKDGRRDRRKDEKHGRGGGRKSEKRRNDRDYYSSALAYKSYSSENHQQRVEARKAVLEKR